MFTSKLQTTDPQKLSSAVSVALPLTPIKVALSGTDGNAFALIATVSAALRRGGRGDLVEQFQKRATAGNYDDLLQVCLEFVEAE